MGDKSEIEWTEATWNPFAGCSVTSPGCRKCYAMSQAARIIRMNKGKPSHYDGTVKNSPTGVPVWTGKLASAPEHIWLAPIKWKRPRMIFANSMSDMFHENMPLELIVRAFAVMAVADHHTFQVLSKRSAVMRALMNDKAIVDEIWLEMCKLTAADKNRQGIQRPTWPLPNVWLGVSVEDQRRADERIPDLARTPATVRFLSMEPLLEEVDISKWLRIAWECSYCRGLFAGRYERWCPDCQREHGWSGSHPFNGRHHPHTGIAPAQSGSALDWVIVGGESGNAARGFDVAWARSILDQAKGTDVAVFVKQLGSRPHGKDFAGGLLRDRKGGAMDEWPADLRIREMPNA